MPQSVFSRNYEIFLEHFRSARLQAGTQEEIAKRIGQTQTFVSKCERGERRIDVIELMMFCKAFRVDAAEFILGLQRKMGQKAGVRRRLVNKRVKRKKTKENEQYRGSPQYSTAKDHHTQK